MRLWTYHPPDFRIDDLRSSPIDPTKGPYWNDRSLCYRKALPRLCTMLGIDAFPLWCFTAPDCWLLTSEARVEWELEVPEAEILGFIHSRVWDVILKSKSDDWQGVIVTERPVTPGQYVSAMVRFPLSPDWEVNRLGKVVDKEWSKEASFLKTRERALQLRYIKMYRDHAADEKSHPLSRARDAERADYLEEYLGLRPPD